MGKPAIITRLTPEQEARFPEFVKKWTAIGLSTKPSDRPRAEAAIIGLYKLANLKEPRIIWLPCPISAALSAVCYASVIQGRLVNTKGSAVHSAVRSAVDSAVGSAVHSAIGSAIGSAVHSAVHSAVRSAVHSAVDSAVGSAVHSAVRSAVDSAVDSAGRAFFGGSLWPGYAAWADYFNEVCGIAIDRNYLEMTESCGFYWTLDNVCFASERPSVIHLDGEGRLHSENDMSIQYAGTSWGLYHWHGTQVPAEWIIDKDKLTPQIAITWKNIEQRRAACEILGWHRILDQLNAKTINQDSDPEIGELVEVTIPQVGKERFLRVQCGTKREFALPVPQTMKTALEAQAWTWGLDPKSFVKPEVRT